MLILDLRQPRQRECAEGDERSAQDSREDVSGPPMHEKAGNPAGEREAGDQHQVVNEDGRRARP